MFNIPKNHHFYERKWLNKPGHHSVAFILARIQGLIADDAEDENVRESEYEYANAELTIGDCSRQITLSFDFETEEERLNSLHKLHTLMETLQGFEEEAQRVCALAAEQGHRRQLVRDYREMLGEEYVSIYQMNKMNLVEEIERLEQKLKEQHQDEEETAEAA